MRDMKTPQSIRHPSRSTGAKRLLVSPCKQSVTARRRLALWLFRSRTALVALLGIGMVCSAGFARSETPAGKKMLVRATLDLADGSRLVGTPLETSLALKVDFATLDVPLAKIRQCEIHHKQENVVIKLQNGDETTGVLTAGKFPMETVLGNLTPTLDLIDRITFSVSEEGALPPGDGPINFGNVNWTPWRTMFEIQGDKLVSLPKVRPGFNYGHFGNGRSATLVTNIGNLDWRDYSVEFEMGLTGVNPAHNPHGLPADFRSGGLSFHVADTKESWNEKGESHYNFGISGDGSWTLGCCYNGRVPGLVGYQPAIADSQRTVASGKGLKIDPVKGNKIRLSVVGTRIQIWVDGESIVDIRDEKMGETIGGQTLDHGGIAISWGWECIGWIRNFSATKL